MPFGWRAKKDISGEKWQRDFFFAIFPTVQFVIGRIEGLEILLGKKRRTFLSCWWRV